MMSNMGQVPYLSLQCHHRVDEIKQPTTGKPVKEKYSMVPYMRLSVNKANVKIFSTK